MARAKAPATAGANEDKSTQRVVLQKQRVIVLPANFDPSAEKTKDALKGLGNPQPIEAWTVVGEFEGASKQQAIQSYAGKPGTPDAKVGTFKAPSRTAWAGGRHYEAPPQPLVQAKDIE